MSRDRTFRGILRIAGVDCDGHLKIPFGLRKIKGIGINFANALVRAIGLPPDMKLGYLTDQEVSKIEEVLRDPASYGIPAWMFNRRRDPIEGKDMQLVGPSLEMATRSDIELMKKIGSWKGVRHSLGLKVRGQRTRTTGRKGRTVGVIRKGRAAKEEKK